MDTLNVGVIGAGVMGTGVAQVLAERGLRAILIDVKQEALVRARQEIRQNIRAQNVLRSARQSSAEVLANISFTEDYDCLRQVNFVIENVVEKWAVKKGVYECLDRVCPQEAIFAANTSAIPITQIASATRRPEQVIGIHFMNPVTFRNTVELIPGRMTSEATIQRTEDVLKSMGKQYVKVHDAPGFVSNRVLMLTINEAVALVKEGTASAPEVDRIFRECFGHQMGPLETGDLIGWDTVLLSLDVLYEFYREEKFKPCSLLQEMVSSGHHGRKTGEGFYEYQ